MNRRAFLRALGFGVSGLVANVTFDLDRLLWVPGQKTIFIPSSITLVSPDWVTREAVKILMHNLRFAQEVNRDYDQQVFDAPIVHLVPPPCGGRVMGWAARANAHRRAAAPRTITEIDDVTEAEALTTLQFWVGQIPDEAAFDAWIAGFPVDTQDEVRRQMLPFVTFLPAEDESSCTIREVPQPSAPTSKYHEEWTRHEDVVVEYGADTPTEEEIVYACYDCPPYEGRALVVFQRDGKLYESEDWHCSCNGLECWAPEETSVDALLMREGWPGLHEAVRAL